MLTHLARIAAFAALFTGIAYALVVSLHASIPLYTSTVYACGETVLAALGSRGTVYLVTIDTLTPPAAKPLIASELYAEIRATTVNKTSLEAVMAYDARSFAQAVKRLATLLKKHGVQLGTIILSRGLTAPAGVLDPTGLREALRALEEAARAQGTNSVSIAVPRGTLIVIRVYRVPSDTPLLVYTANTSITLAALLDAILHGNSSVAGSTPFAGLADTLLGGCELHATIGYRARLDPGQAARAAAAVLASAAFFAWDYGRSRRVYARLVPERLRGLLKRRKEGHV